MNGDLEEGITNSYGEDLEMGRRSYNKKCQESEKIIGIDGTQGNNGIH